MRRFWCLIWVCTGSAVSSWKHIPRFRHELLLPNREQRRPRMPHVIVHFDESKLRQDANAAMNATTTTRVNATMEPGGASDTSTTETMDILHALLQQRAQQVATAMGGSILYLYQYAFYGVAIALPATQNSSSFDSATHDATSRLDAWDDLEDVAFVQQDYQVSLEEPVEDVTPRADTDDVNATEIPSGLDRIDQSSLPLDGRYTSRWTGTGVIVFVLDTGLRSTHSEFASLAVSPVCGWDAYRNDNSNSPCEDHHNHGTHVAGIIGGRTSGVAKNVTLVSVKVVNKLGFGSDAAVYAGLDYVMGQRMSTSTTSTTSSTSQTAVVPMVVNVSLSGLVSWQYNRLVRRLVRAGVVVVAAAGNGRRSACLASPASSSARRHGALTVGASTYSRNTRRDRRAGFSNFGACVDLLAPGTLIPSASARDDTTMLRKSGTSFAAPHVTGAVALYLQKNPTWTPAQVRAQLLEDTTKGALMRIFQRRSPNRLLYTGNI